MHTWSCTLTDRSIGAIIPGGSTQTVSSAPIDRFPQSSSSDHYIGTSRCCHPGSAARSGSPVDHTPMQRRCHSDRSCSAVCRPGNMHSAWCGPAHRSQRSAGRIIFPTGCQSSRRRSCDEPVQGVIRVFNPRAIRIGGLRDIASRIIFILHSAAVGIRFGGDPSGPAS